MCPLRQKCAFLKKFAGVKHERLQKVITHYCANEEGHEHCIHFQAYNLFGMQLDECVAPGCQIIPRAPHSVKPS